MRKQDSLIISTLLLCFPGSSCFSQTSADKDLSNKLVGEWRNNYMKISMNSYNNTDRKLVTETDSSNWEEKLKIRSIRTHFELNGIYYSEYLDLKDSIVRRPTGQWFVKNDTLVMTQLTPSKEILKLHLAINEDMATFSGIIDFDGDGKEDDDYYGIQKKFR